MDFGGGGESTILNTMQSYSKDHALNNFTLLMVSRNISFYHFGKPGLQIFCYMWFKVNVS